MSKCLSYWGSKKTDLLTLSNINYCQLTTLAGTDQTESENTQVMNDIFTGQYQSLSGLLGQITNLQEYIRCKTLIGSPFYVVYKVYRLEIAWFLTDPYLNSRDQNINDFPPNPPDMNHCSYEMNNEKPWFQRPYKNFTTPYPYPDP